MAFTGSFEERIPMVAPQVMKPNTECHQTACPWHLRRHDGSHSVIVTKQGPAVQSGYAAGIAIFMAGWPTILNK